MLHGSLNASTSRVENVRAMTVKRVKGQVSSGQRISGHETASDQAPVQKSTGHENRANGDVQLHPGRAERTAD